MIGVTNDEYVEIIASLLYVNDPNFRCNEYNQGKWLAIDDDEQFEEEVQMHQQINYCKAPRTDGRLPQPYHHYKQVNFFQCPCAFYNNEINTLMELYFIYEKHGPNDMLYMYKERDISAKLYQALTIVGEYINNQRAADRRAQEAKANSKTSFL